MENNALHSPPNCCCAGNCPFFALPGHSLLDCFFRFRAQSLASGKASRMGLHPGLSCQHPDGVLRAALRQKSFCKLSYPKEPPAGLPSAGLCDTVWNCCRHRFPGHSELISALELIVDRILKVVVPLLENLLENPDIVRFLPEELLEFLNTMDWESRLTQLLSLITEGLGATVIIAADTLFR